MKYFFSGPLFTTAEREWNSKLVCILRSRGFDVYLPQENTSTVENAMGIFNACIEAIDKTDVVISIMDGSDPDSGSAFECGYAYAKKKQIYTVRTDFRKSGDSYDPRFNLMLTQSSKVISFPDETPNTEQVAEAIIKKLV